MKHADKPLVVVADDDRTVLRTIQEEMRGWECRLVCVQNKKELLQQIVEEVPSLLLLDLFLGEHDGIELMRQLLGEYADLTVVLLTAHATVETAVTAIRLGAFDYLAKPADMNRLRVILKHTEEKRSLNQRIRNLEQVVDDQGGLWGESTVMRKLRELIASVAPTEATVLILGESGTGKELVARSLHRQSPRHAAPFVAVNMAALPRELVESTLFGHERGSFTGADQPQMGCCEAAEGGTLFLDEIGDMDAALQAKLLRFLQERSVQRVGSTQAKRVNVRVIAATNQDLRERIRAGQFREDLFYRLNVVPLTVPPLREHLDDVPLLAGRFLQHFAIKYGKEGPVLSRDALAALSNYDWPGNVRQLENLVERLVILGSGGEIDLLDLPPEISCNDKDATPLPPASRRLSPNAVTFPTSRQGNDPLPTMEQIEKQAILAALTRARGNVRDAAQMLGYGQATVYRKIKRLGITFERLGRVPNEGPPDELMDKP